MTSETFINNQSPLITKGDNMTQARLELDDYTTRVLDVIKGKHGLKNRSEALNKFAKEFGEEYVEPEVDEKVVKELDAIYNEHVKKYGKRSMTDKQLRKLLGV